MFLTKPEEETVNQNQSSCGKMYQECSIPKTTPSDASLVHYAGKILHSSHQGLNGRTLVMCLDPKEQSRGVSSTPNISEWPNAAVVCLLSQVLEKGSIPSKYYLSPKACEGILRRAEVRGAVLPTQLVSALRSTASQIANINQGGDIASTISARDYKSASDLIVYGIPGNWIGRSPENGGNATTPMNDIAPCLTKTDQHGVSYGMSVRRLTPVECERLQGFPDNYTSILSDSDRYKALGNSVTTNVLKWIGERIQLQI